MNSNMLEVIDPSSDILNQVADEIVPSEIASAEIQGVIDRMFEMAAGKGYGKKDTRQMVGLAAPQLGVSKRIIFIDLTATGANQQQNLQVIINPKIVDRSDDTGVGREACWSTGNICGIVERSSEVVIEGLDRNGEPVSLSLIGFVARIAQHETDHLDGIRFPDRIPFDEPGRLHLVTPEKFEAYRNEWATWDILCERKKWEELKAGIRTV
jgi:peptide deformylase